MSLERQFSSKTWIISALMMFLTFGGLSVVQFSTILFEKNLEFSKAWIGTLLMASSLMSIVLPFLLQWIQRWVSNPNLILSALLLLASLSVAALPFATHPLVALVVYCLLGLAKFGTSNMQITNAMSLTKYKGQNYFLLLRSIGTLGFAVFCLISMALSQYWDVPQLYWLFSLAYLLGAIASLGNQDVIPKQVELVSLSKVWKWFQQGPTFILLALVTLANMTAFIGASYVGNFIQNELDGTPTDVSIAWSTATFLEIPFFGLSIWILNRFGLKQLLFFGMITNALRLILTAHCDSLYTLYAIQGLHGIFYGATLSGFSIYLNQYYKSNQIHHLQLFSSFLYAGIGSSLAGKLGASLWDYQDLRFTYQCSGVLAILVCIALLFVRLEKAHD